MNPRNFFAELKRRNVYRAAVAYGVVAWFLTQLTTQVFPFFEIPNSAIRLVVIALAIGFPIAMSLSWLYELTPEGIVRSEDIDPATAKKGRRFTGRILDFIIIGVLLLVIAMLIYEQRPFRTSTGELITEKSIAVLPLVNTTGDPGNDYFSDGLSEELIGVLAKIPGLKIIGRGSSFLFKGKPDDSRAIGEKLRVANLLEGSVRKQGDRVRIVAELINAADGRALWSDTYDREVKDIFAIQSEIAQAVAAQLKIRLLGEKPTSDSARSNPNPAAHDAVLQSAFYLNQGNMDGYLKAINYATEATGLDPNYAEAWAQLSIAWRAYLTAGAPDEAQAAASARAAANKAYALDPKSIDALVAMVTLAVAPDLDFAAAEKYARRAVELAPGNVDALAILTSALIAQGRLEETVPIRREIGAADPLQGFAYGTGVIFVGLHRYAEARALFNKFLETHPKADRVHTQLATLDVLENNPKGALEHAHLEQEGGFRDYSIALALQAGSDESARDAALQAFIDKQGKGMPCWVAVLYAQRHQPDKMFEWLETAYTSRDVALSRLFIFPFLTEYRDDPRFAAFCRKLGIENLPPKP